MRRYAPQGASAAGMGNGPIPRARITKYCRGSEPTGPPDWHSGPATASTRVSVNGTASSARGQLRGTEPRMKHTTSPEARAAPTRRASAIPELTPRSTACSSGWRAFTSRIRLHVESVDASFTTTVSRRPGAYSTERHSSSRSSIPCSSSRAYTISDTVGIERGVGGWRSLDTTAVCGRADARLRRRWPGLKTPSPTLCDRAQAMVGTRPSCRVMVGSQPANRSAPSSRRLPEGPSGAPRTIGTSLSAARSTVCASSRNVTSCSPARSTVRCPEAEARVTSPLATSVTWHGRRGEDPSPGTSMGSPATTRATSRATVRSGAATCRGP